MAKTAISKRRTNEDYEVVLAAIESDPRFLEIMKRTDADIRAGRVYTQKEVESRVLGNKKPAIGYHEAGSFFVSAAISPNPIEHKTAHTSSTGKVDQTASRQPRGN